MNIKDREKDLGLILLEFSHKLPMMKNQVNTKHQEVATTNKDLDQQALLKTASRLKKIQRTTQQRISEQLANLNSQAAAPITKLHMTGRDQEVLNTNNNKEVNKDRFYCSKTTAVLCSLKLNVHLNLTNLNSTIRNGNKWQKNNLKGVNLPSHTKDPKQRSLNLFCSSRNCKTRKDPSLKCVQCAYKHNRPNVYVKLRTK